MEIHEIILVNNPLTVRQQKVLAKYMMKNAGIYRSPFRRFLDWIKRIF